MNKTVSLVEALFYFIIEVKNSLRSGFVMV